MDRYDRDAAYLTDNPEKIKEAWQFPTSKKGGSLFVKAARNIDQLTIGDSWCGCLTQIRIGGPIGYVAETLELTEAIHADTRLPDDVDAITIEHLPVFAEWQRRLDMELQREWPEGM